MSEDFCPAPPLFHDPPIDLRIRASGQHGDDVGDREIPFFFVFVPSAADLFFFKQDDAAHSFGESKICSGVRRLGVGEAVAEGKQEGGTHRPSRIAENWFLHPGFFLSPSRVVLINRQQPERVPRASRSALD